MIWIVDDDRRVRVVLSAAMHDAGYATREFADAELALAALDTDAPDALRDATHLPVAATRARCRCPDGGCCGAG